MRISDRGLQIVKDSEGLRLKAYKCPADVWTIGYGHTRRVKEGDEISVAEAEALLRDDIGVAERAVSLLVNAPLEQNEFDALVSFTFNVGAGALQESTLLRLLNDGNKGAAAAQFSRWVFGGGEVLPGLSTRRSAERDLFLGL
jgi:lysozyme